ncbi:Inosose dehydratase [Rubellimicrobium mesophilum DSM 19309]|uniref:Inosose dehydratase n=1 Tax=Rubellimicrobium mesophilum DSM 19309 TaxID=442562 RepID=A0A017HSF0_9RHOB|nr:hypothetical protein [Rubellimicrobium mesophilum]EYD76679.1 Inosose dehydratase [Rubellimicrobium mesophilum DSM 19309]
MKARLGIAPISSWNHDLADLSDDVSLEECLRQAPEAEFTGMETGHRLPMDRKAPRPNLDHRGIRVRGGWFPDLLPDGNPEAGKDPNKVPPAEMARIGQRERMRVRSADGYEVAQ